MLTVITLLILVFVVVSSFVIVRFIKELFRVIFNNEKKNQKRNNDINKALERIQQYHVYVGETQKTLDEKMDALSRFIDERNTYVIHQQEQFKAFAKSDMLSARRDELVRVTELKVALERIISMTTMSRQSPAAVDALALESVTNRIKELEMILESS